MTRLAADGLVKYYRKRKIVNTLSFHINVGEIVGLLGPNGAGKTTSFYMLVGLLVPDHGHILLDDQDITELSIDARARLGITYLPQEPSVFRKLTVTQNIMAILELRRDLNAVQRTERLTQLLDDFNLHPIADYMGHSLSGGERRRTEIARALAVDPKFILLDEPFAGVDPISISDIKELIVQLQQRGIGVLITDHNVRETLDICERAYVVNQGSLLCEGDTQTILNHPQVRAVYLGEHFYVRNQSA